MSALLCYDYQATATRACIQVLAYPAGKQMSNQFPIQALCGVQCLLQLGSPLRPCDDMLYVALSIGSRLKYPQASRQSCSGLFF